MTDGSGLVISLILELKTDHPPS